MDILRRKLAPLIDSAWAEIDKEARNILATNLSGRRVVDLVGPSGYQTSAINLGRLDVDRQGNEDGLLWGQRLVQPLIEIRVPFSVSLRELDNLARGAGKVQLGSVSAAAHKAASFEERAVYLGFPPGGILGLREASEHLPIGLGEGSEPGAILDAVTRGLLVLHDAGVTGPFELVLGPEPYAQVLSDASVYPLRQQLTKLLAGPPIYSPVLGRGGFLISTRGGDFELTLGQDLAIGYEYMHGDSVHLFLLETFTFRVLGPEAVVALV